MHRSLALGFALALSAPAQAESVAANCAALTAPLRLISGYEFDAPPAADADGWCVFDGAKLRTTATDRPNASAERLRLRGATEDGALTGIDVDIAGLRLLPKAGDRNMNDRLRSLLRLQTVDVRFSAQVSEGVVALRPFVLRLGDGMELSLEADGLATGLDTSALLAGNLTALRLNWRNDGRTLRPVMEMVGEAIQPDVTGVAAVDAARAGLANLASRLPEALFVDEAQGELDQLIAALPQGRGRLELTFAAPEGMSAARVAVLALSKDPGSRASLSRLFAASTVDLDWQPGLDP